MSSIQDLTKYQAILISNIQIGAELVNLGQLVEIEEYEGHYTLVIARMNEKQVMRFEKNTLLFVR